MGEGAMSGPWEDYAADDGPWNDYGDARAQRMAAVPQSMANIEADQKSYSPLGNTGQNLAAGAGQAVVNLYRGAKQRLGMTDASQVTDDRALDAPLMATTAGKLGNFAGNVAMAAPTAFVPGANTVTGAGVIGAGMGLLQPSTSPQETAVNAAAGLVGGAGGQKLGQYVAPKLGQAIANRKTAAVDAKSANSVRDTVLRESRKLGYKVPPATVNQQSVIARGAESVAGKVATQQTAAVKNQQVTNRLVRQEFGLSNGAPLSRETLKGVRKQAGKPYAAVEATGDVVTDQQYLDDLTNLSQSADELKADFPDLNFAGSDEVQALQNGLLRERFSARGAIEATKKLRSDASKNLAWNVEDPSKKALGLAQREAAGIIEEQVIRHLQAQGKGSLATAFDRGRQTIAKTYSVQSALNEGSGNVVATKLAAQLRKGKPLSGNLEKIARFASTVDTAVAREQTTSPGVSKLMGGLATAGGLGGLATGNPMLAAASIGLPAIGEITRRTMLSGPVQRMAAPSYAGSRPAECAGRNRPH
jgi:hypothetical protein